MPWAWELCLHCMDISTGTILNWPIAGDWLKNAEVLRAMRTVWKSWKFHTETAAGWTPSDLSYLDWLSEGTEKKKSKYELWAEKQNG